MELQQTRPEDRLITDKEVARLLGISRSWPWKLAQAGKFPAPIKLSARCTRWRLSAVREWMADPQGWQASNEGGVQ
ncbi:DNA-binding protein [Pollutimonas subterranea]|uniref:DNA-binding protein n=1 Tax=Pollutimonas subterranea TaxID=2045210 RepID=A0A2N4U120_9BURK|nr:AlpA family phage regulatory protein [Pollutimonas subterranea]PLC48711.1 DNA-binding protein [Pollutimonas subterranea]